MNEDIETTRFTVLAVLAILGLGVWGLTEVMLGTFDEEKPKPTEEPCRGGECDDTLHM